MAVGSIVHSDCGCSEIDVAVDAVVEDTCANPGGGVVEDDGGVHDVDVAEVVDRAAARARRGGTIREVVSECGVRQAGHAAVGNAATGLVRDVEEGVELADGDGGGEVNRDRAAEGVGDVSIEGGLF